MSPSSRPAVAGLLAAALLLTAPAAPALAAGPAAAVPTASAGAADPTNIATDEDKVKACAALGISPGVDLLVLDDQAFVLALWRASSPGSFVRAEALRAWESTDQRAAYGFIVTGIFVAVADDARAEIVAEQAKALRRSVAVTVGLDPSDTALIEKNDRDFIFSVWQRVAAGSHVRAAAEQAIRDGSTAADWTAFLTGGARVAAEQDIADAIAHADAEEAARLAAQQLATAKRSLLQLLLLPVTDELINAPDRQYVLHVHNTAPGTEVKLASQAALNTPDAGLAQALRDFIVTGGAAANTRDEQAAAALELAGYRTRATAIRDAARTDGFRPSVLAAAEAALADGTLLGLQTFLLKGQDAARAVDDEWRSTFLKDFTGDDRRDIAAIDRNGDLKLYVGDGAGKVSEGGPMAATARPTWPASTGTPTCGCSPGTGPATCATACRCGRPAGSGPASGRSPRATSTATVRPTSPGSTRAAT